MTYWMSQGTQNFSLLSGFWQVQVHPNSRVTTAFVTPQGLHEFHVMPFGLTNAPAVFLHLMQKVLIHLIQLAL